MIQTKEIDNNLLEAEFYSKEFLFSYSSLNTLLTAPVIFYREYILGIKEEEVRKYLIEGILIHYLVLEHQGFDDKFLILSDNLPSANTISVIEHVYEHYLERGDDTLQLIDFRDEILEYLREINLHQSLKDTKDGTGDDKRIAKIIDATSEEYFDFLKKKKDRIIIDSAMLDRCTKRADIVKADSKMRTLLGMDRISDGRTFAVYNELPIKMTPEELGLPFGLKGILDNVVIDVHKKLIWINDFKTTSKTIVEFEESVSFWNYWLQAAIYYTLVKKFFNRFIKDDWTITFRFIVFDKYDQLYPFEVTQETIGRWLADFEKVKEKAKYHYESKDYSLPYDFAQGNVKL